MCKCVWVPPGSLQGSYMDPYMDPIWISMWILYGSSICWCVHTWSKMYIFHWKYVQIYQGEYGGASWIPIRIRHRSLYGSYMDPYVDLIWVVYLYMCSQLSQNVNIPFEICANVSGGLGEAAGARRGKFGEGSGAVRWRFGEGSGTQRGSQRQTPLWTYL